MRRRVDDRDVVAGAEGVDASGMKECDDYGGAGVVSGGACRVSV